MLVNRNVEYLISVKGRGRGSERDGNTSGINIKCLSTRGKIVLFGK